MDDTPTNTFDTLQLFVAIPAYIDIYSTISATNTYGDTDPEPLKAYFPKQVPA
jgi:hypothetical protein